MTLDEAIKQCIEQLKEAEDCFIIPLRQIVEIRITSSTETVPEMELTIKGVMKNDM